MFRAKRLFADCQCLSRNASPATYQTLLFHKKNPPTYTQTFSNIGMLVPEKFSTQCKRLSCDFQCAHHAFLHFEAPTPRLFIVDAISGLSESRVRLRISSAFSNNGIAVSKRPRLEYTCPIVSIIAA